MKYALHTIIPLALSGVGACGEVPDRTAEGPSLGPEELSSSVLNAGEPNLWPGGIVPYEFHSGHWDMTFTDRETFDLDTCRSLAVLPSTSAMLRSGNMCLSLNSIFAAMDEWERNAPVRFVERDTQSKGIEFRAHRTDCSYNAGLTWPHVGAATSTNVVQVGGCGAGATFVYAHELGHALGFEHEQQRSDRDAFVQYSYACFPGMGGRHFNFDKSGSNLGPVGPFDHQSVMMYSSYGSTRDTSESEQPTSVELYTDSDGDEWLIFDVGPLWDSIHFQSAGAVSLGDAVSVTVGNGSNTWTVDDGNAVDGLETFNLHPVLGVETNNWYVQVRADELVSTTSYADLEDPNFWTVSYEGLDLDCPVLQKVAPYDITSSRRATWLPPRFALGPTVVGAAWHMYGDSSFGTAPVGGQFAETSAMGDFDGDGVVDAAFGAGPQVYVFRGVYTVDNSGDVTLVPWRVLNHTGDVAALAAGDFNGDGSDELVVGEPTSTPTGRFTVYRGEGYAPMDRHGALTRSYVYSPVYSSSLPAPTQIDTFGAVLATNSAGEPAPYPSGGASMIGQSLTVGDINSDGVDDLLVGSPGMKSVRPASMADGSPSSTGTQTGTVLAYVGHPNVHRYRPSSSAPAGATYSLTRRFPGNGSVSFTATSGTTPSHIVDFLATLLQNPDADWAEDLTGVTASGDVLEISYHVGEATAFLPDDHWDELVEGSLLSFDRVYSPNDFIAGTAHGHVRGSHAGAGFGSAMAVGDFNHDGCNDVAIGAPGDFSWLFDSTHGYPVTTGTRVGQVYVYHRLPHDLGGGCESDPEDAITWTNSRPGSEVGYALAAAPLYPSSTGDDLAIGDPTHSTEAFVTGPGRVYVMNTAGAPIGTAGSHGVAPTLATPRDELSPISFPGRGGECPGERFGHALAADELGGAPAPAILAIGAPLADPACVSGGPLGPTATGGMFLFEGGTRFQEVTGTFRSMGGEGFGSSITAWPYNTYEVPFATDYHDGKTGFVVGAPGGPSDHPAGTTRGGYSVFVSTRPLTGNVHGFFSPAESGRRP